MLKLHNFSRAQSAGRDQEAVHDDSGWTAYLKDLAVIDLPVAEAARIANHRIAWRAVLRRVTSTLDDQQEL